MSATSGVRWYCPNRDCNWSFVATITEDSGEPRCVCGSKMRRGDAVLVFHYLDFLGEDAGVDETLGVEKE